VREQVVNSRNLQEERFLADKDIHCNAQMTPKLLALHCELNEARQALLKTAMERLNLSAVPTIGSSKSHVQLLILMAVR